MGHPRDICYCGDYRKDHPNNGPCNLNGLGHGTITTEDWNDKCFKFRKENNMRQTHSLATLPISKEAFEEIKQRLLAVSYYHVFHETASGEMLDMNGIALVILNEDDVDQCAICDKKLGTYLGGVQICRDCASRPIEDSIQPKEELSRRDKNYYLGKENK